MDKIKIVPGEYNTCGHRKPKRYCDVCFDGVPKEDYVADVSMGCRSKFGVCDDCLIKFRDEIDRYLKSKEGKESDINNIVDSSTLNIEYSVRFKPTKDASEYQSIIGNDKDRVIEIHKTIKDTIDENAKIVCVKTYVIDEF